jgi:hypothetical protein
MRKVIQGYAKDKNQRRAPQSIGLLTASIGGLGGNGRTRLPLSNRLRGEGSPCS